MSGAGHHFATVVDRDAVRVDGRDAASYLQGQISQDVTAVGQGEAAWSLVLDPSGKLAGWFRLHHLERGGFLLDTEAGAGEALIARLERFRLRTEVTFEPEPGWRMLAVRGAVPDRLPDGLAAAFHWPEFSGVDVLVHGPIDAAQWGVEVDDAAFEQARIRAGVPRMGVDIDVDTIPAEAGRPVIEQSVSFTKGCYTGQELVARIDSRGGQVPRPLRVIEVASPVAAGATVRHAGTEVGRVTSAAAGVALGPVMRKIETGSVVEVDGTAGTVR